MKVKLNNITSSCSDHIKMFEINGWYGLAMKFVDELLIFHNTPTQS